MIGLEILSLAAGYIYSAHKSSEIMAGTLIKHVTGARVDEISKMEKNTGDR